VQSAISIQPHYLYDIDSNMFTRMRFALLLAVMSADQQQKSALRISNRQKAWLGSFEYAVLTVRFLRDRPQKGWLLFG
jgi:hypothetical protein